MWISLAPRKKYVSWRGFLMSPKFQKRSALKFAGRIILGAQRRRIWDFLKTSEAPFEELVESMTFAENECNEI